MAAANRPRTPRRVALLCGLAASFVVAVASVATIATHDWQASVLVRVGDADAIAPIARAHDPEFRIVAQPAHYDGVYFYAIALDPFARGNVHTKIDHYQYRYGHPGYGWLARVVALGAPHRVPLAMALIGIAAVGLAAWAVSLLASHLGASPWWGLSVAASPGMLVAATMDMSEPLGVALAAIGMWAWLERSSWAATGWLAAAALVKEVFAFVALGLALFEVVRMIRARRFAIRRIVPLAAAGVPLLGWYVYLRLHFGVWPFERTPDFFDLPVVGWIRSFRLAGLYVAAGNHLAQVGNVTVPLLAVTAVLLIAGAIRAVRLRTPFDAIYLLLFGLAIFYNWYLLLFPKDMLRDFVLPMLLLPAVLAARPPRARAPAEPAGPPP